MHNFIDGILRLGASSLASEDAACDALVRVRFPNGIRCPRCQSECTRLRAHVVCNNNQLHTFTILYGTPFHTKTRPRVQALLLAIQAFASSHRSISARELARRVDMPHVTLWRHLHTLRALMQVPPLRLTRLAEPNKVMRRTWIRTGARTTMRRARRRPPRRGNIVRIVGQSVRTWLNGTFHGVSPQWLSFYLREICARWAWDARVVVERFMYALICGGRRLIFRVVRERALR
jgi:hypothetical protein